MIKFPYLLSTYASKYFHKTIKIVSKKKHLSTIKFFTFDDDITLCGIKFIKQIIKNEIEKKILDKITIYSLSDGDIVHSKKPVLIIQGHYKHFALFEGIFDGILTRLSSISTNVKKISINPYVKDFIFMADRNDIFLTQPYDGYAAYIGGARNFVTKSMMLEIDDKNINYVGTMPHSLIQQHQGNLIETIENYLKYFPNEKITALIDYNNDCIGEIEKIANSKFRLSIGWVRIDTSKNVVDKSLQKDEWKNNSLIKGVNSNLIWNVRNALDKNNLSHIKIIVSSGINEEKIESFSKENAPVDCFGIGSWFLRKSCHFSADLIKINDKYESKYGRNNSIEKEIKEMKRWIF
ncbi:MAG: nicotinate phosphoribosyltransferase [Mycoplasmoidaceae bacterium]